MALTKFGTSAMLAAPGAFISTTVIVVIVVVVCGQVQTARLSEPSDAGSQDSSGSGNEGWSPWGGPC